MGQPNIDIVKKYRVVKDHSTFEVPDYMLDYYIDKGYDVYRTVQEKVENPRELLNSKED